MAWVVIFMLSLSWQIMTLCQWSSVTIEAMNAIDTNYGFYAIAGSEVYLDNVSFNSSSILSSSYGIYNDQSKMSLSHSRISVEGVPYAFGIFNTNESELYVIDSEINITGGFDTQIDMICLINSDNSKAKVSNSNLIILAEYYGNASGIYVENAFETQVNDSTIAVYTSYWWNMGIQANNGVTLEITNTKIIASGGIYSNTGLRVADTQLLTRDSSIYGMGGEYSTGVWLSDHTYREHTLIQTVISAEGATPNSGIDPWSNANIGVYITGFGHAHYTFIHDTILVPEQTSDVTRNGGVGINNDGGNIYFDNSIINKMYKRAFVGIFHQYDTETAFNRLYVSNSEIHACTSYSFCNPIRTYKRSGVTPGSPIAFIASSLLAGYETIEVYPVTKCTWVYDQYYDAFGWPTMGTIAANYNCP